jgi:hypothetical protein
MNMKALIISFLFLTANTYCFAQNACNIKKASAWYNASMPGMQRVDENGNPVEPKPNITRFIYVEYSGLKLPEIKSVAYNGVELSFTTISIKEKTVWAGDKTMNPNNSITAKKGNSLLKIDLQPAEGKTMPDTGCKSIVIKSNIAGKLCRFYVPTEKEFATPPMY